MFWICQILNLLGSWSSKFTLYFEMFAYVRYAGSSRGEGLSEYEMSFLLGSERRYQLNIYSFKLLDNSFIEWFNWLNYRGFQSWCRSSSFPGWGNLSHKSTNAWLRYTKFECWQKANQPSVTEFIKAKADATQGATVVYLM